MAVGGAKRNDGAGSAALTVLAGAGAGAIGVWALDRVDWFLWRREGEASRARTTAVRPKGEPPAQALVTKVEEAAGRSLSPAAHEAASQAVHYSIGIAPAIGYALVRDRLPGSGVGRGALFGLGLFALQDEALNSVTGLGAKPGAYPWQAHARGLVAHAVFGVTTELALQAFERLRESGRANNHAGPPASWSASSATDRARFRGPGGRNPGRTAISLRRS